MFQSLQRKTDLNAHLKKEIYSDYTAEWMACQRKYLASQNSFSTVGKGRKLLSIPADLPYQNDPVYSRILFDEMQCRVLDPEEEKPKDVLTLQDGGNFPMVMSAIASYFAKELGEGKKTTVLEIAELLTREGYRKHGKGVLHMALDYLMEAAYGIEVTMLENANQICDTISKYACPVILLVEASYMQADPFAQGNQAICVWGYTSQGDFFFTDMKKSPYIQLISAKETVLHSSKAWACKLATESKE